jgi:Tol biopolymer transport system component
LRKTRFTLLALIIVISTPLTHASYVPYQEEWGIYKLTLTTGETQIIYSSRYEITAISVDSRGDMIAFSMNLGDGYENSEIFTVKTEGGIPSRLTENAIWDVYPVWSPEGDEVLYLSRMNDTLDIWKMNKDGTDRTPLYDSGGHDADIDWRGTQIAFTRDSQIWVMNSDGSNPHKVTSPPRAGEWGNAPLPFGDYDPRISPDGSKIVYERLVNDDSPHGNYELYLINSDGSDEHPLTHTEWTQGMASWSSKGDSLIYLVSAMGTDGKYEIYSINLDGSGMTDLTSELYPTNFLAHSPILSNNDTAIYFVGQWWDWEKLVTDITCSMSTKTMKIGEEITLSGKINPIVYPINITVTIEDSEKQPIKKSITSSDGTFDFTFKPEYLGTYMVYAEWSGDLGHNECTSKTVSFNVLENSTERVQGSLPGFPLVCLLSGLAVVLFYKRHSMK